MRQRNLGIEPTLFDRVVGYFDPVAGAKRLRARAFMALAGGYIGARRDRRQTSDFNPGAGSADADLLPDLPTLRDRSRHQVRNSPIAGGAVSTTVSNVVGTGLTLQSRIDAEALGMSDDEASAWQKQTEREFALWAESSDCDITRTQNFYEQQGLCLRTTLESGDAFTILPMRTVGNFPYDTRIQIIEADRVCNKQSQQDGKNLAGGVVLDDFGAPTAYHILRTHPGSLSFSVKEWDTVPAFSPGGRRNVLHHFIRKRPGQNRGEPFLAPVIEPLKMLDRYSEAELMAAVVASMFTVFIKSDGDGLGPMEPTSETGAKASDKDFKMGPAAILEMRTNDSVEIANPTRPNAQFDPFFTSIVRQIGVALEIPYEVLIKHFTASYSAARAALMEAWRFFRGRREWISSSFCQPVYEAWLEEAVARGRVYAPGFFDDYAIRHAYCRAMWIGDGPGQIDPVKEIAAARERIDALISTRAEETTALTGGDWETKFPQIVKESQMIRDAGLEPGHGSNSGGVPPAPPAPAPDPNDPNEDQGDKERQ